MPRVCVGGRGKLIGRQVRAGDTRLWADPRGEACPLRSARAHLRKHKCNGLARRSANNAIGKKKILAEKLKRNFNWLQEKNMCEKIAEQYTLALQVKISKNAKKMLVCVYLWHLCGTSRGSRRPRKWVTLTSTCGRMEAVAGAGGVIGKPGFALRNLMARKRIAGGAYPPLPLLCTCA